MTSPFIAEPFPDFQKALADLHPYDGPEIIALEVSAVAKPHRD
jgi:uncharacterized protein involved in tolerance to divalent cations